MRRRTFLSVVVGSAATSPHGARAKQPAMPVVGLLSAEAGAIKRPGQRPTIQYLRPMPSGSMQQRAA